MLKRHQELLEQIAKAKALARKLHQRGSAIENIYHHLADAEAALTARISYLKPAAAASNDNQPEQPEPAAEA